MEKVKLGKSEVEITPIVFGAWAIGGWMWGGNDDKEGVEAIHASLDHGISSIDTAPIYGFGHSEELVGKAINGKSRDKIEILTKCGLRAGIAEGTFHFESQLNDGSPVKVMKYSGKEGILFETEESLKRLGTDYIDLLQIHWHDPSTPLDEAMEAFSILIDQGKIRAAGVCNYSGDLMEESEKSFSLASNQVPYSMVLRDIEEDVVPYCLKHGNAILAYSPLQRGVLTGKITSNYKFSEGDHRPKTKFFQEPNLSRINDFLNEIQPIAEEKEATLAQLVTNWTIQQPGITAALVGARNAKQVDENVRSLDFTLTENEIALINELLGRLKLE